MSDRLVQVAGMGADAANEVPAAERGVTEKPREDSTAAGWDPYEVWRTRVKESRVPHKDSSDPHERD
jgi:hypothetical protein